MGPITLATWNVLHRIHAMNHNDGLIDEHPDEAARIAGISALVAGMLARERAVVCLQEVSGDQLASLRARLGRDVSVLVHTYARVPSLNACWLGTPAPPRARLIDPCEQLVTLVPAGGDARRIDAHTFAEDRGKGLLVVRAHGVVVANTHLSFGSRRARQLGRVADAMRAHAGVVVVAGDFNAELAAVRAAFGSEASYADVAREALGTHPRPGRARQDIDQVIALRGRVANARVLDAGRLSDHNPVVAEITAGEA